MRETETERERHNDRQTERQTCEKYGDTLSGRLRLKTTKRERERERDRKTKIDIQTERQKDKIDTPAKSMKTFSQNNSVSGFDFQETDDTFKSLHIGDDVKVVEKFVVVEVFGLKKQL
jgi:hypothetical protein